jgi:hypothetical protein
MAQERNDWIMGALAAQLGRGAMTFSFSPFSEGRLAVPRSPVFVLLGPCCPATVTRLIISVIIDPIKRQAGWLFAHVSKKIFKTVSPPITNSNASPAVVFELFNIRVVTAGFHFRPRTKCSGPAARCVTVGDALLTGRITLETPTRLRVSVPQISYSDSNFVSANTTASPKNKYGATGTSFSVRDTENSKTAKLLTCDINEFGQGDLRQGCCVKWRPNPARFGRCVNVAQT